MPASLAEQLYARWRERMQASHVDGAGNVWIPPWSEADDFTREAWEAVALDACRLISSDLAVVADGYPADSHVPFGMRHAIALIGVHDVHAHAEDRLLAVKREARTFACKDCQEIVEVEAVRCSSCCSAGLRNAEAIEP